MKRCHPAGQRVTSMVVAVLVILLAPAVLLFGEAVNRRYRRGLVGYPRAIGIRAYRRRNRAAIVVHNPVWIALTAPARWLVDHFRPRVGGRRGRGGNGPPGAGVREPRRPLPDLPAGAMALPEPRSFG
jgi:hypothetical protein